MNRVHWAWIVLILYSSFVNFSQAWFGSTVGHRYIPPDENYELENKNSHETAEDILSPCSPEIPKVDAWKQNESFPNLDPDHTAMEYRVRIDQWSKRIDLNCYAEPVQFSRTSYVERHTIQFNSQLFQLYQKDHFPFKWKPSFQGRLSLKNAVLGGYSAANIPFFICRVEMQIGMVSLKNGLCYLASNPTSYAEYDVLTNPQRVTYSWINLTNWNEVPINAVIYRQEPFVGSQYIGQVHFVSGPLVLGMTQDIQPEFQGRINDTVDQVLVTENDVLEPEYRLRLRLEKSFNIIQMRCSLAAGEPFDPALYHKIAKVKVTRDIAITSKLDQERYGSEYEETVQWQVFEKIPEPSLVWVEGANGSLPGENPVLGVKASDGSPHYICRCVSCEKKHASHYSAPNWKITNDTALGSLSLQTGKCHATSDHLGYDNYQVLTNPHNLTLIWRPFDLSKHDTNGAVIAGRQSGNAIYIGKLNLKPSDTVVGAINRDGNFDSSKGTCIANNRVWVLTVVK